MNKTKNFLFLALAFLSVQVLANNPKTMAVKLDQAFIPTGFDDNDRTQILVSGVFGDTCYKVGSYKAMVDDAAKTISITQNAYYYNGICLDIMVPFSQTIDVGLLKAGTYTVKDSISGTNLGTVAISPSASEASDDFLYAPVADAVVRSEAGKTSLFIRGSFPDRCMRLKQVVVNYYQDVVVVQPIVEMTGAPRTCGIGPARFEYESPLKSDLKGTVLFHIRTMEGQSLNNLVSLQ